MNYRKTFNSLTLIVWSTIAVIFFMCFITQNNAEAKFLFKTMMDYRTGHGPSNVAIGDLNGDASPDLAVAYWYDDNVSVLLNNGDGSFQSAVNYETGFGPSFVAIGDLDLDGDLDLAVTTEFSSVSVLLGNGDGSFQSAVHYDAEGVSIAIGDIDGDGDLDLVTDGISVLLGNGDGSFLDPVSYSAGDEASSVAIGDLDGDGDLDLAVTNETDTGYVSVLLGNGDGSFIGPVNYATGAGPRSVAIGDLDQDGDLDLAVADQWGVSVLLNNGDGSFQSSVSDGANDFKSLAIGDLNGDGDLDLVAVNYSSVSVLLGWGDGSFRSAMNFSAGGNLGSVAIGELNGDSVPDLAIVKSGGDYGQTQPGYISVLLGNGDGSFIGPVNYATGAEPRSVAIGDLDQDGDLDLAVADQWGVSVLLNNGDGTFERAANYGLVNDPMSVAIGDLDGDGDLDLAVTNRTGPGFVSVMLGNGDGSFLYPVNYATDVSSSSVAIGDLNGDGKQDLAVANSGTDGLEENLGNVSVLLGNGDGSFQSAVNYETGFGPSFVAIGDLNGDGDLDLAVANEGKIVGPKMFEYGDIAVLLGNGDGSFQDAVNYTADVRPRSIAIEDLDGDGDLDLAVANSGAQDWYPSNAGNVSVLLGNGDGTFQSAVNYESGNFSITIGDLNGDGHLDLAAVTRFWSHVSVLLGNGDGSFQNAVNYGTGDSHSVAIGDLNGDSNLDLAVANYRSNNVSILINTGRVVNLFYTPVTPCRIVDTRKAGGIVGASKQRHFRVYGSGSAISAQGGNPAGCSAPFGEPLAAHINMVAVNPMGKGNLQAFPVGAEAGAGLSVNYNTIDTNLANAGTVKTVTGSGPDITVASNFSSAHTAIDVLGYYYPDEGFYYTPVNPCRIIDTRKTSAGIIIANTQRNFDVFGSVGDQGGDPFCPSTLSVDPEATHINMVAVDPSGKGNLQAFPVGAGTGAGLSVNYNTIDTNLANAGTVKTVTGSGPDITVASNFSSAHTVIDVLGYYSEEEDLLYTPVSPCRIVDTRKTSAGIINANTQREFRVFGPVSVQGGNSSGCSAPMGEPLAAHINMIAVNPTSKGNLQAFPVGAGKGAGLSVNYNTIDTNLANAGTVKTVTGSGPDISVASNFSSAHTVIDVLGYYYLPFRLLDF